MSLQQWLLPITFSDRKYTAALQLCQGKGGLTYISNEEQEKTMDLSSSASQAMEGDNFQWTRGLENVSSNVKY